MKLSTDRFYGIVHMVILFFAFQLLGKMYFDNRSMFLDEINLVRNIIELDNLGLFGALEYGQFAPPLFLVISKMISGVFGNTDLVFRLFPFICAIGSLLLFYRISSKFFSGYTLAIGLILFGLSPAFLIHGSEAKQYAVDLFIGLVLVYLALPNSKGKETSSITLLIAGMISIWVSMPAVFVLAGIGLSMVYKSYKVKSNLNPSLVTIAAWLFSFGMIYFFVLKSAIGSEYLHQFHQPFYFGRNGNVLEQLIGVLTIFIDKTALPIAISILLILFGIYKLYESNFKLLLITLVPILTVLVSSFLMQYSILSRLMLFTLPFWIWLMMHGVDHLFAIYPHKKWLKGSVILLTLIMTIITVVNKKSYQYLVEKYEREEGRASCQFLSQTKDDYPVYYTHHAMPTYEYYCRLSDYKLKSKSTVFEGNWDDDLTVLKENWLSQGIDKIWIFDVHTFSDEKNKLEAQLKELGKPIRNYQDKATEVRLFQLK